MNQRLIYGAIYPIGRQYPFIFEKNSRGCWKVINRPINKKGMIRAIYLNGKGHSLGNYGYRLFKGEIPEGLLVRHTCDEPMCFNPEHLILGTDTDNSRDCVIRGRKGHGTAYGEDCWKTTIKEEDVINIFYEEGIFSDIAKKYGISRYTVGRIKSKKTRIKVTSKL